MRLSFIIALVLLDLTVQAQETKEEKRQTRYEEVLSLVDSENFEFIAQRANPPRVRPIDLTTNPNFLRITSNKGSADMPYFGRAYSGGYSSSDGGITFDGPFESYDVTKNDSKRRVVIKFKVRGSDDTYNCTLTISSMESVSLNILSNKRQAISYSGYVREIETREK
jgi:hypothetical protein